MTNRGRPRVHLFTGGPTWEERRSLQQAKTAQEQQRRKKLAKKHRAALQRLDASIQGLRVALRHKELELARSLRAVAWERVKQLPPELTGPQRKALFDCKLRMQAQVMARRIPWPSETALLSRSYGEVTSSPL
ncbi:hypothetical protein [Streptomyces erythrochromogenes]|uniref:hypothetical protein n=1 Tax=Streptomyces erythrochromogenes TaxID=285574 RepID=UPI00386A4A56|nr:hypothetical protein OG364_38345 [Streptomyces erythrochromogenes]